MARPEKVAAVEEVSGSLSSNAATLVTDYRGLSVTELAELRAKLRENNAQYKVVKNTLTKRAAEEAGIDGLAEFLEGPTALVFCEEDPVGPMKVIRDFMKDHPELLVKAGWVEGEILDEAATTKLADLKSRDELLAEVVGLFHGALANFARLLRAPLEHQARLLKALEDAGGVEAKGFEPEGAEAPAAAADEPAEDDQEPAATDEDDEPEASDDTADEAETSDDTPDEAAASDEDEEPTPSEDAPDETEASDEDEPEAADDADETDDTDTDETESDDNDDEQTTS